MEMTQLLGEFFLVNFYNHPKHDTSAPDIQWNLIWLGLAGNLGSNSLPKNMLSCLSILSGLPNYQIHRIQETGEVLFRTSTCGLALACHEVLAMACWYERLKTSALVLVHWAYFTGLAGNVRGQGSSHSLQTLHMAKHWAEHVGTLEIQYHLSTP